MTDLFDVIEWDKCQFVMYSEDKKGNTQVHYHTPLIYIPSASDTRPAFYSVKSSKFGVSVRPEATHWAICLMDDLRNEVLFEGPLPGVYEYITVDLSATRAWLPIHSEHPGVSIRTPARPKIP